MHRRKSYILIVLLLFAVMGIAFGLILGYASSLKTQLVSERARPIPTVYITKSVKPKIIRKTVIKYRNGYQYIGDNPAWNCAGNWYNAYIRLANDPNQPAGDSSLWNYYCPGIPQPSN